MSRHSHTALFSPPSLLLILLIPLLLAMPLSAVEMKGLYEVEVPVEGQSAAQRRTAIREAFYQVLVKVTGRRQLNGNIQRNASRYVQQYRYRTIEAVAVEVVDELIADDLLIEGELEIEEIVEEVIVVAEPERLLWVRFDSIAVNRLLREKGVPIWGAARPSIVIWLSQEQQGQRTMMQPEMVPEVVLAVEEQAQQRGLPAMLPLMDLEDYQRLPVSALWGGFAETIQYASSRYGVEVALTGQLVATADQWQVEWRLYQDELSEAWIGTSGGTLGEVVAQGIEQMSDRLAERYTRATTDDSLSQLQVVVTDIEDLAGYARVRRYFESLVMVEQALLLTIESNRAEFLISVQGGAAALIQGVKLGSVLTPMANEPIDEIVEVTEVIDETFEGPSLPKPIARERATFRLR